MLWAQRCGVVRLQAEDRNEVEGRSLWDELRNIAEGCPLGALPLPFQKKLKPSVVPTNPVKKSCFSPHRLKLFVKICILRPLS